MAIEYPDVMNDITDARQRFESGAVQYLAEFPFHPTPAGDIAPLSLTLQSIMDVPVQIAIRLDMPQPRGKLKRLPQPLFQVLEPEISLTLEDAEVAQVRIPVHVQPHLPPGEYALSVSVRSAPTEQGTRVRLAQSENRLGDLFRYPQGLGITQIASWGFRAQKAESQSVPFGVSEAREPAENVDLSPQFNSWWTLQDWEILLPARRELNERRIHILPQLVPESLYLRWMKESQAIFASSNVQLDVAEAVFLAKILTHTVMYMKSKSEWQDCLLIPIYAYARASAQPTDDALWLVTQLGYAHVLELSIALSFSLVEKAIRRKLWNETEQRAVRDFIVGCLDTGGQLPGEFLYLPLLLGGMLVAREVVMEGEEVQDSLRRLAKAKAAKSELFADADLSDLNAAFDHILAQQTRR